MDTPSSSLPLRLLYDAILRHLVRTKLDLDATSSSSSTAFSLVLFSSSFAGESEAFCTKPSGEVGEECGRLRQRERWERDRQGIQRQARKERNVLDAP
jgi:hypothetical protein